MSKTTRTQKAIVKIRRAFSSLLESIKIIHDNLNKIEKEEQEQEQEEEKDNNHKTHSTKTILLVGDCGVGKTSFISKLKENTNVLEYIPTDCISSYDVLDENSQMMYKIYDLSGDTKEDPRDMLDWFTDVEHIIIMCSLDNYDSIKSIKHLINEYSYFTDLCIPFSIIVNKVDVFEYINISEKKKEKYEKKIEHIASKHNLITRYISVHEDEKDELLYDLHNIVNH